MANTFLRKISRNIGTSLTAVGSYTVGANVGAVIVGLNISNTSAAQIIANVVINNGTDDYYLTHRIPVAAGGAVSIAGGDQKIILQTGDTIKVNSSATSSLDVLMNIMETDGAGITTDPTTYSITSNISSVNEGNTVGFTVSTSSVPDSTVLYWTTVGNVSSADFTDSVTSGNVTIADSSAIITRTLTADATTEGVEYFDLALRTDSISGTIVATSGNVTVVDTSLTPVAGAFSGRVAGVNGNYGSPTTILGQTSTGTLATFTNSTSVPAATGNWLNIASSDTVAMTVSMTGNAAITTDGSTWTAVTSLPAFNPNTINIVWAGLAYGAGTWVAIAGGYNAQSTQVAYSTDNGTSWTSINPLPLAYHARLEYANGNFIAIGSNKAYSSTNGITWVTTGAATATAVSYSENLFYAAGTVNAWYLIITLGTNTLRIQSSTDAGATWSSNDRTVTGISGSGDVYPNWGNGVFVVIQQGRTTAWTSTDAVTWTSTTNAFGADSNSTYFTSLVFTNGYFIATTGQFASFTYNIWFSSNGTTWTKSATVGTNQISRVTGLT